MFREHVTFMYFFFFSSHLRIENVLQKYISIKNRFHLKNRFNLLNIQNPKPTKFYDIFWRQDLADSENKHPEKFGSELFSPGRIPVMKTVVEQRHLIVSKWFSPWGTLSVPLGTNRSLPTVSNTLLLQLFCD